MATHHARSGAKVPIGASRKRQFASPLDKAKGYEVVWKQVSGLFEAARPYRDCSFVYFIGEEDGPIKIGVSKDPVGRLRNMQTGNPRRLRVEHVLLGDMALEKLLHEFWEPHAIVSSRNAGKPGAPPGTEWFESDARAELLPILDTAAAGQIACLAEPDDVTTVEMERIARDAHYAHGFVPKGRDHVRMFGTTGTVISRPSRI